ncbi:hypothetical protein [Thiocystis violacea]|uniref:hypothetical protein n=1 Tax=Thiocystis violacea TaxID=13725 RepID=UPI0019041C79|nr:hypothetical protein [Thiocystis violacea]MBK1717878.1 hypothetical protein [Thiocystis violacea]
MQTIIRSMALLILTIGSSPSWAAPEWYVGYSFIYTGAGNICSFMRFRTDSYSVQQADVLYNHLTDHLAKQADEGATFAHTLPSVALARGQSGEQMAAEFLSSGVGACDVAGQPADSLLFISSFACDYQNEAQLCTRLYVDTGNQDATSFGIDRGPATVGGFFVKRPVWEASSALVYDGRTTLPFAVDSMLNYAASGLKIFTDENP